MYIVFLKEFKEAGDKYISRFVTGVSPWSNFFMVHGQSGPPKKNEKKWSESTVRKRKKDTVNVFWDELS